MRQQAWLNTAPKPRRQAANAPARVTRLQQMRRDMKDDEYQPPMPPLDAAEHVVGFLWEIGPVLHGSMGAGPVTHEEIACWQQNIGVRLEPWEARFIRALSHEYLAESTRAESPDAQAPWQADGAEHRAVAAQGLKNAIRGIAGQ